MHKPWSSSPNLFVAIATALLAVPTFGETMNASGQRSAADIEAQVIYFHETAGPKERHALETFYNTYLRNPNRNPAWIATETIRNNWLMFDSPADPLYGKSLETGEKVLQKVADVVPILGPGANSAYLGVKATNQATWAGIREASGIRAYHEGKDSLSNIQNLRAVARRYATDPNFASGVQKVLEGSKVNVFKQSASTLAEKSNSVKQGLAVLDLDKRIADLENSTPAISKEAEFSATIVEMQMYVGIGDYASAMKALETGALPPKLRENLKSAAQKSQRVQEERKEAEIRKQELEAKEAQRQEIQQTISGLEGAVDFVVMASGSKSPAAKTFAVAAHATLKASSILADSLLSNVSAGQLFNSLMNLSNFLMASLMSPGETADMKILKGIEDIKKRIDDVNTNIKNLGYEMRLQFRDLEQNLAGYLSDLQRLQSDQHQFTSQALIQLQKGLGRQERSIGDIHRQLGRQNRQKVESVPHKVEEHYGRVKTQSNLTSHRTGGPDTPAMRGQLQSNRDEVFNYVQLAPQLYDGAVNTARSEDAIGPIEERPAKELNYVSDFDRYDAIRAQHEADLRAYEIKVGRDFADGWVDRSMGVLQSVGSNPLVRMDFSIKDNNWGKLKLKPVRPNEIESKSVTEFETKISGQKNGGASLNDWSKFANGLADILETPYQSHLHESIRDEARLNICTSEVLPQQIKETLAFADMYQEVLRDIAPRTASGHPSIEKLLRVLARHEDALWQMQDVRDESSSYKPDVDLEIAGYLDAFLRKPYPTSQDVAELEDRLRNLGDVSANLIPATIEKCTDFNTPDNQESGAAVATKGFELSLDPQKVVIPAIAKLLAKESQGKLKLCYEGVEEVDAKRIALADKTGRWTGDLNVFGKLGLKVRSEFITTSVNSPSETFNGSRFSLVLSDQAAGNDEGRFPFGLENYEGKGRVLDADLQKQILDLRTSDFRFSDSNRELIEKEAQHRNETTSDFDGFYFRSRPIEKDARKYPFNTIAEQWTKNETEIESQLAAPFRPDVWTFREMAKSLEAIVRERAEKHVNAAIESMRSKIGSDEDALTRLRGASLISKWTLQAAFGDNVFNNENLEAAMRALPSDTDLLMAILKDPRSFFGGADYRKGVLKSLSEPIRRLAHDLAKAPWSQNLELSRVDVRSAQERLQAALLKLQNDPNCARRKEFAGLVFHARPRESERASAWRNAGLGDLDSNLDGDIQSRLSDFAIRLLSEGEGGFLPHAQGPLAQQLRLSDVVKASEAMQYWGLQLRDAIPRSKPKVSPSQGILRDLLISPFQRLGESAKDMGIRHQRDQEWQKAERLFYLALSKLTDGSSQWSDIPVRDIKDFNRKKRINSTADQVSVERAIQFLRSSLVRMGRLPDETELQSMNKLADQIFISRLSAVDEVDLEAHAMNRTALRTEAWKEVLNLVEQAQKSKSAEVVSQAIATRQESVNALIESGNKARQSLADLANRVDSYSRILGDWRSRADKIHAALDDAKDVQENAKEVPHLRELLGVIDSSTNDFRAVNREFDSIQDEIRGVMAIPLSEAVAINQRVEQITKRFEGLRKEMDDEKGHEFSYYGKKLKQMKVYRDFIPYFAHCYRLETNKKNSCTLPYINPKYPFEGRTRRPLETDDYLRTPD